MKYIISPATRAKFWAGSLLLGAGLIVASPAAALAAAKPAAGANDSQRVTVIKSKADQEITRRLNQLGKLQSLIANAQKLSTADKTALSGEVSNTVSGLTSLKTKIDADTDLATLKTDVQAIFAEYRVYALVMPKVRLIRTADDQQAAEAKLQTLAGKLQTRIASAKANGKDVTTLQTQLDDLNAKVAAAQSISAGVEQKVLPLQPTDYNSDHGILSGYQSQLKTAHQDNQAAFQDAKAIVQALKKL